MLLVLDGVDLDLNGNSLEMRQSSDLFWEAYLGSFSFTL